MGSSPRAHDRTFGQYKLTGVFLPRKSIFENAAVKPSVRLLRVRRLACGRSVLFAGATQMRCAIGRSGATRQKREGDGASPIGRYKILRWLRRPNTYLGRYIGGQKLIRPADGWCDDLLSGAYNRPIRLPFRGSHERLWRDDVKYHVIGVLDYNLRAPRRGMGSAIFFHLADDHYAPTAGCVAISSADMRKLSLRLGLQPIVEIF